MESGDEEVKALRMLLPPCVRDRALCLWERTTWSLFCEGRKKWWTLQASEGVE
jgi:hypothetical protein